MSLIKHTVRASVHQGSSGHFLLLSADKPDGDGESLVQQDFIPPFTIVEILNNFKTMVLLFLTGLTGLTGLCGGSVGYLQGSERTSRS